MTKDFNEDVQPQENEQDYQEDNQELDSQEELNEDYPEDTEETTDEVSEDQDYKTLLEEEKKKRLELEESLEKTRNDKNGLLRKVKATKKSSPSESDSELLQRLKTLEDKESDRDFQSKHQLSGDLFKKVKAMANGLNVDMEDVLKDDLFQKAVQDDQTKKRVANAIATPNNRKHTVDAYKKKIQKAKVEGSTDAWADVLTERLSKE